MGYVWERSGGGSAPPGNTNGPEPTPHVGSRSYVRQLSVTAGRAAPHPRRDAAPLS